MSAAAPQLGDRLTLVIDRLAYGGEGVGRVAPAPGAQATDSGAPATDSGAAAGGLAVFVREVCPGERVEVEVTEVRQRLLRARLVQVLEASPQRTAPVCPVFGQCGGCQWQHLEYGAQVAAKTAAVRDALVRLGKLPAELVRDCLPCPLPFGYRNKIELTATLDEQARLALAYHSPGEEGPLVPVGDCPLALPEVNGLLEAVTAWLRETGWPPYHLADSSGLVREAGLRCAPSTGEASLLLTTGRRDLPDRADWFARLRQRLPQLVGIRHRARTRASQTPTGRTVGQRLGRPLQTKVGDLSLRVSPDSFFQVNEWMIGPLLDQVRAALDPQPRDIVADLYAGVGLFGLSLAREVGAMLLLEVEPEAAEDARANARHNRLDNVRVGHGQVEQKLSLLCRQEEPTKFIVDPPRQGLSEPVLRIMAGAQPQRIVYVSCDPTTLARDLARLARLGYGCEWVQPLDLFPQTYHVESIAALARLSS